MTVVRHFGRCAIGLGLVALAPPARAQCPDGSAPPCGARARPAKPALAIAAFQNASTDSSDAYLAASITDELTGVLRSVVGLQVLTSSKAADYLLRGTVLRVGQALQVSARLEQPATGRIVWNKTFRLPSRSLVSAPDSIASGALGAIGVARPVPRVRQSSNGDVYDLYARGVYQMNRRNQPALARAVALFHEAIARDSNSALGWIGLARALERSSNWRFSIPGIPRDSVIVLERMAADRAGELDPQNSDVWLMRARVAVDVDVTSRSAALRALRNAVALDATNGEAWQALGLMLMETDDTSGARVALERGAGVSPGSGEIIGQLALHHFWMRNYALAAHWADSAASLDPTHTLVRNVAGFVAYERARWDEAESHFEASKRLATGPQIDGHIGLAKVAARRGDLRRARALIAEALARTDTIAPVVHAAQLLAEANLALDDTASALSWLERFQPRRDMHFQMHLRYEPGLDALRRHPRFLAILTRP